MINVLFYRDLFAVDEKGKEPLKKSDARKKIIKYLKELGVQQIKPLGHERFVSKSEVEKVTEELFSPKNLVSSETYTAKSGNSQDILGKWG